MNTWAEWNIWDTTNAVWLPHVAGSHVFEFGKHYVGDRLSGAIYEMSMAFVTDEIVAPV
jgi:hypothetical protein